jgi:hypothetical protein
MPLLPSVCSSSRSAETVATQGVTRMVFNVEKFMHMNSDAHSK